MGVAAAGRKCDEVKLVTVLSAPEGSGDGVRYGEALAVSGDMLVVSADQVHLYKKDGKMWTFRTTVDSSPDEGNLFGAELDLSGSVFATGAILDDAEDAVDVYETEDDGDTWDPISRTPVRELAKRIIMAVMAWRSTTTSSCTTQIVRVDGVEGAVDVYRKDGMTWNFVQTLIPEGSPDGRETLNVTFTSVAIAKPFIAVGSDYFVVVFYDSGESWTPIQELENSPDGIGWNIFGTGTGMVAIDKFLVIGATQEVDETPLEVRFGSAYVYTKDDGLTWTFFQKLEPPGNDDDDDDDAFILTRKKATYVCEPLDLTDNFG